MKKKSLSLALALLMIVALVPVSLGAAAVNESDNRIITLKNDGVAITDKSFDSYFKGTALDAVKALLAEGKVYVNGIRVPVDENSVSAYEVNGLSSLYKTNTGWGYNVHKTTSSNNLSFADARLGFFQTITTVRGHVVKLYRKDVTGAVEKIMQIPSKLCGLRLWIHTAGLQRSTAANSISKRTESGLTSTKSSSRRLMLTKRSQ